MAIIKAGTYRFNNVLQADPGDSWEQEINFYFDVSGIDAGLQLEEEVYVRWYCSGFDLSWFSHEYDHDWLCYTVDRIEPETLVVDGVTYNVAEFFGIEEFPYNDGVYKGGWGFLWGKIPPIQTIVVPIDANVTEEVGRWFYSNTKRVGAVISHNGQVIANLFSGQTATLKCAGQQMIGDVVVNLADLLSGVEKVEEVVDWPKYNVQENVLYKVIKPVGYANFCYLEDTPIKYSYATKDINELTKLGINTNLKVFYRKNALQLKNIKNDSTGNNILVCYVADDKVFYAKSDGLGLLDWYPVGCRDIISLLFELPCADEFTVVTSEEEIVDTGRTATYIVLKESYGRYISGNWKIYEPSSGTKMLFDSSSNLKDVDNCSKVINLSNQVYFVRTEADLPAQSLIGSIGIILGGE